jgi:hypothetical protein
MEPLTAKCLIYPVPQTTMLFIWNKDARKWCTKGTMNGFVPSSSQEHKKITIPGRHREPLPSAHHMSPHVLPPCKSASSSASKPSSGWGSLVIWQGPSQSPLVLGLLLYLMSSSCSECLKGLRRRICAWEFWCVWVTALVLVPKDPVPGVAPGDSTWAGEDLTASVPHLSCLWVLFTQLCCGLESPAYRNGPGISCSLKEWLLLIARLSSVGKSPRVKKH